MYSKQEASFIRKKFWTTFGQYMKPIAGGNGDTINWLNYKTGIKHIYFRLDATVRNASAGIEIRHPGEELRQEYTKKFEDLRLLLEEATGEVWTWENNYTDEDGNLINRISITLNDVNVFKEEDWPALISFFKPRIIAFDRFWNDVKDMFAY